MFLILQLINIFINFFFRNTQKYFSTTIISKTKMLIPFYVVSNSIFKLVLKIQGSPMVLLVFA
jgi:hypothetical protein